MSPSQRSRHMHGRRRYGGGRIRYGGSSRGSSRGSSFRNRFGSRSSRGYGNIQPSPFSGVRAGGEVRPKRRPNWIDRFSKFAGDRVEESR